MSVRVFVVDDNLVAKARAWSAGMADAGRIWHSTLSDGVTADWKKLGENVGMGGSVDGLHTAFVNSPHHYENLVDPAFEYVGIGVVRNGGTIYVSEVFMQLMPAKAAPAPTTPTTAPRPTTTTAPPVAPPAAEAAPADPPRAPSDLLVSVLERLRTFDS